MDVVVVDEHEAIGALRFPFGEVQRGGRKEASIAKSSGDRVKNRVAMGCVWRQ